MSMTPLKHADVVAALPEALHADFPSLVAHAITEDDWEDIAMLLDKAVDGDPQKDEQYWDATIQLWLLAIAKQLSSDDNSPHTVYESEQLTLISNKAEERIASKNDELLKLVNFCQSQLTNVFEGEVPLPPFVIAHSKSAYQQHLQRWAPRSEGALNVDDVLDTVHFIAEPVPQLVIYDLMTQHGAVARELTLAILNPVNRPKWLDRATALRCEASVDALPALQMDKKTTALHRKYWNPQNIQQFWNGSLFENGGNVYADALALYILQKVEDEFPFHIEDFAQNADADDGGDLAAIEIFGEHLGNFLTFLRTEPPKNWQPQPKRW